MLKLWSQRTFKNRTFDLFIRQIILKLKQTDKTVTNIYKYSSLKNCVMKIYNYYSVKIKKYSLDFVQTAFPWIIKYYENNSKQKTQNFNYAFPFIPIK